MEDQLQESSSKDTRQLDLLLLKAESYSKFILENQKRSQSLLLAQNEIKSNSHSDVSSSTKRRRNSAVSSPSTSTESLASLDNGPSTLFRQPVNLVGGMLMPHQLEGLQWLLSLWENGLNGILADEVTAVKTILLLCLTVLTFFLRWVSEKLSK
jgi:ATP-dependent DNA helicase